MEAVLLIGHVGKLVKLAAGVMNTHSRQADCRMEVLASHAAMAGAEQKSIRQIMHCVTTAEAIELLKQEGLLHTVMESVMERIAFYLRQRCQGRIQTEAILFSREEGVLGETGGAVGLLEKIKGEDI